jgi:transmembrane sensor
MMRWLWRLQGRRGASEWFALVRSGHVDERADRQWAQWMADDVEHEKAYENRELAWELTAELKDAASIQEVLRAADSLAARGKSPSRGAYRALLSWPVSATAVAVALVAVLIPLWLARNAVTTSEYATAVGEQRTVTLSDNSTVVLNTGTRVRVEYSRAMRELMLLQGEALFMASADPARPFRVRAQEGVTTVLGTEFAVRIEGTAVSVVVLSGSVSVASGAQRNGEPGLAVTAGQGVSYSVGEPVSPPATVDIGAIRGWQAHRIVFSDVTLAAALKEYNRYVTVPIVLGNPELAQRHINGVFVIGDESAFLGALRQGLHLQAVQNPAQTTLVVR